MRKILERTVSAVEQIPRHPEVDQENPTALEPNDEILAAPLDGCDSFSFELGRHFGRVVGTYEPRIVDGNAIEAPPEQCGLELRADAFDLRQLRHAVSVVVRVCLAARPTAS